MTDRSGEWAARHRAWETERLDPARERAPERKRSFSTISDMPIEPLYGPWSASEADPLDAIGLPGEPPFTRGIHPSGYRSRLWTMRMFAGFGAAEDTNARFRQLLDGGSDRPVDRVRHADAVRLRHRRPGGGRGVRDVRRRGLEPGRHGGPARRPAARARVDLDDHQFAGRADLGDVHRGRGEGRRLARPARGDDPERHPQGVRRPEGVPLPAGAVDAPGDRHHRVRDARAAALEHGLDQRLPHPRGGLDRGPGAGLHDRRRDGLCRGGPRARPADRRLRAASQLLLQQPQRLLRGDRQVPRVASHLAHADDRALWRRERAVGLDAVPHPDRGCVADSTAATQQPDPGGAAGARRRAWRDAVAAHRCLRRSPRGPDRGSGDAGAPPAADHRRGERRGRHGRPARRFVVRRGADRRDRTPGLALPRRDRPARRDGRGHHRGLSAARDRRRRLSVPARVRRRRAADRRDQRLRRRRRADAGPRAGGAGRLGGTTSRAARTDTPGARRGRGRGGAARPARDGGTPRFERDQPHAASSSDAPPRTRRSGSSARSCARSSASTASRSRSRCISIHSNSSTRSATRSARSRRSRT